MEKARSIYDSIKKRRTCKIMKWNLRVYKGLGLRVCLEGQETKRVYRRMIGINTCIVWLIQDLGPAKRGINVYIYI